MLLHNHFYGKAIFHASPVKLLLLLFFFCGFVFVAICSPTSLGAFFNLYYLHSLTALPSLPVCDDDFWGRLVLSVWLCLALWLLLLVLVQLLAAVVLSVDCASIWQPLLLHIYIFVFLVVVFYLLLRWRCRHTAFLFIFILLVLLYYFLYFTLQSATYFLEIPNDISAFSDIAR